MEKYTNFDQWHDNETSKWDDLAARVLSEKRAGTDTSTLFDTPSRTSHSKPLAGDRVSHTVTPEHELKRETLSQEQAFLLLGYADVLGDNAKDSVDYVRNSESGRNYAQELIGVSQEIGSEGLLNLADQVHEAYSSKMNQLGLPSSTWGNSRSWILWDIAKQRFLAKHPEKTSDEYTSGKHGMYLGDPLDQTQSKHKIDEIIQRHIGWEYMTAPDLYQLKISVPAQKKAANMLLNGERNQTQQLRSFELTKLGKYLLQNLTR